MGILRRNFLGSLLGTFAISQLPWYAKQFVPLERNKPEDIYKFLYSYSDEQIKKILIGVVNLTTSEFENELIEQPHISEIEWKYKKDEKLLSVNFKMEDIIAHQKITAKGLGLIFKGSGKIFRPVTNFPYHNGAEPGDIYKTKFELCFHGVNEKYLSKIGELRRIEYGKEEIGEPT